MNRLQVGDECYVRIVGGMRNGDILKLNYGRLIADLINHDRKSYRLVYPYPCIKALFNSQNQSPANSV